MIVRCTRNNANTTTALTRRPFVRMLSNSRPASRFSRSSNTSLKSSSGTNRTSFKSTTSSRTPVRTNDYFNQNRNRNYNELFRKEHANDKKSEKTSNTKYYHEVLINQQTLNVEMDKAHHKKSIMESSISIPTTINEESSRMNSTIAPPKITPVPSMEAINEESSSTTSTQKDKNRIEMLTFAVISTCKSGEDCSNSGLKDSFDQETAQVQLDTSITAPTNGE